MDAIAYFVNICIAIAVWAFTGLLVGFFAGGFIARTLLHSIPLHAPMAIGIGLVVFGMGLYRSLALKR